MDLRGSNMRGEWPREFEVAVRDRLTAPPPLGEMDPALDLAASGLDSLETIRLMTVLEDEFEIWLPDDAQSAKTFATPGTLWQVVAKCIAEERARAE